MKMQWCAVLALAASAGFAASTPDISNRMVITVHRDKNGQRPENLAAGDVTVMEGKTAAPVVRLQRLTGDLANMQLFIYLDDSTRSAGLGQHLGELEQAIKALPPTTQVAVGYMHNGTFSVAQPFTADHEKAASSLRLPFSIPGVNGSPYFALSDLVRHWPSKEATGRRAVLMLTDGIDEYYNNTTVLDDPYVDTAISDALKHGVMVYSIYLRGAGYRGLNSRVIETAQSRMMEVSDQTGGYAYFEEFTDPVSVTPFMKDLQDRLNNQYEATFQVSSAKGIRPVKLKTETPGLKVTGPSRIYVP
jgi:hypothetical protein